MVGQWRHAFLRRDATAVGRARAARTTQIERQPGDKLVLPSRMKLTKKQEVKLFIVFLIFLAFITSTSAFELNLTTNRVSLVILCLIQIMCRFSS